MTYSKPAMRYLFLIGCAGMMACGNDSVTATASSADSGAAAVAATRPVDTVATRSLNCYVYQTSNNIVSLQLHSTHAAVSGRLMYDFMGKDKSEGTISGTISGDTLYAAYKFISAGKQSLRQVAFLKRGTSFIEGSAGMEKKGDTMIFSKTDTLQFNGIILKETPCP